MNANMKKAVVVAIATWLYGSAAQADVFGGLEAAYTRDDNFTGAPAGGAKTAESLQTYSAYVGAFWPQANQRSAWVVRGDVADTRLNKFSEFNNTGFGLSGGVFHPFNERNSMTATLGAYTKRFDDGTRDYDVYALQFGFKQKTSDRFFFREGLVLEKAQAKTRSNEYDGYGINASLNWTPARATLLSLGVGQAERDYSVALGNERTSDHLTLGLVQQVGQYVYLRAGVTHQKNSTNAGAKYDGNVYTVGIGVSL